MREPRTFLNGRIVPQSEAHIPLFDTGFVLGASVTEQLRTFGGRLFRPDDHLQRLQRSLELTGIDAGMSRTEMAEAAAQIVAENFQLGDPADDLGLSVFVTPGPYATLNDGRRGEPCVGMHTYRLPFALWAEKYSDGQALMVTDVQQVPAECWSPELKCRSRMHYFLADRAAAAADPQARAILVDARGHVLEATTASLIVYYENEGIVTPPQDQVLHGISMAVLLELAEQLGIPHSERPLTVGDVARADELLLSSTPFCLLPAVRFNHQAIAGGRPGQVFERLLAVWSEKVGVDIAGQARRFSNREN